MVEWTMRPAASFLPPTTSGQGTTATPVGRAQYVPEDVFTRPTFITVIHPLRICITAIGFGDGTISASRFSGRSVFAIHRFWSVSKIRALRALRPFGANRQPQPFDQRRMQ